MNEIRVSIIGAGGHMGTNIIRRITVNGFMPENLVVLEKDPVRLSAILSEFPACTPAFTALEAVENSDVIILAIKPQDLNAFEAELSGRKLNGSQAVISIVTAKSMEQLSRILKECTLIRCSTNILLETGNGSSFWLSHGNFSPALQNACRRIISSWGYQRQVGSEAEIDTAIVDSGCMPAIVSYVYDSLIRAMVARGRSEEEARTLTLTIAAETAKRELEKGLSPAEVVAEVKTPGGITAEACKILDEAGVHEIVQNALEAADRRVMELK